MCRKWLGLTIMELVPAAYGEITASINSHCALMKVVLV